jgi:hypothetical protein
VIEPTYASNLRDYGRLSFLFKGATLEGWETPAELSMVDGDVIICCRAAVLVMAAGTIPSTRELSPTSTESEFSSGDSMSLPSNWNYEDLENCFGVDEDEEKPMAEQDGQQGFVFNPPGAAPPGAFSFGQMQ